MGSVRFIPLSSFLFFCLPLRSFHGFLFSEFASSSCFFLSLHRLDCGFVQCSLFFLVFFFGFVLCGSAPCFQVLVFFFQLQLKQHELAQFDVGLIVLCFIDVCLLTVRGMGDSGTLALRQEEMSHPRGTKTPHSFCVFLFFLALLCVAPPALLLLQLLLLVPLGRIDASHLLSTTTEEWHVPVTRYVTFRYVTLRYVTLRYVTLRYVTLRYVTLRYVTLRLLFLPSSRHRRDQTPEPDQLLPHSAVGALLWDGMFFRHCTSASAHSSYACDRVTCLLCSAAPLVARAAVPSDSSHCFRRLLCSQSSFLDISTRSQLMTLASRWSPSARAHQIITVRGVENNSSR
jgi:hypothetical protein